MAVWVGHSCPTSAYVAALARASGPVICGSYQGTSLDVTAMAAEDLSFSPCGILNRNMASLKLASC
jgi:hypothetical protein